MPCEFANLNGYCQNTACTKLYSVTYEAYGMQPLTNADRIRAMDIEELSRFLWTFDVDEVATEEDFLITRRKLIEWLQQPSAI